MQILRGLTVVVLMVACQDNSGARFQVGGIDARIYQDARVHAFMDAPPDAPPDAFVFHDAHVFMDAHIFMDAPPPLPVRSCTNKTPVVSQGTENLTIAIVCQSIADQGNVQVTLAGGSGSGAETRILTVNLVCAAGGATANNFLQFPVTQTLLATHIAATLFDIDCL